MTECASAPGVGGRSSGEDRPLKRHDSLRYAAGIVGLLLLYYAAGRFGLSLASLYPSASPVWPASGLALAALLVLGVQVWPAVFLGAFLVNLAAAGQVAAAFAIATGNTLEALAAAWLVTRYAGGARAFDRPEEFLRFGGSAAVLATALSATIGAAALWLSGSLRAGQLPGFWSTWWLGDAVGILVVTPFLVLWKEAPKASWRGRGLEVLLLLLTVVFTGWLAFSGTLPLRTGGLPLGYLCLLPLLWAAVRFDQRTVATGIVLLSAVAISLTVEALATAGKAAANEALLLVQVFLGSVSAMAIGVGSYVNKGRRVEEELLRSRGWLERKVLERTLEISSANADLKQSEASFRELLESAPDAMVLVDRSGTIVLVNAQTERMFGRPRAELLGAHAGVLIPERLRPRPGGDLAGFFADLVGQSADGGLELLGVRRDGTEFPIDINLSPLETAGREGLVSAAIRDITRRRSNEAVLARLAAVVASSDDAIVSTDTDGVITTWNDAAGRLFGYRKDEVLGRPATALTAPGRADEIERSLERLRRLEQTRCESQALVKDGTLIEVGVTAFPVADRAGRLIGYSAIVRDITDQKRTEGERQEKEVLESQVRELSRRTRELDALNEMGDVLRSAVRLAEAYPVIPRYLVDLFPTECGALYELNEGHNLMEQVLTWGEAPPAEVAFLSDECWALRRGQIHESHGGANAMICSHARAATAGISLCVPLSARRRTLGLLHLAGPSRTSTEVARAGGRGDERALRDDYRRRLARTVGQQIASALYDLRLQETLRDQASRDPLTGLFNRRTMEETLHRELYRATRRNTRVGFVLFDLDHFKRFNDDFGHAAGDAVLRDVSGFIEKHTRAEDIVCRYGGEEFLLVLADCTAKNLVRRSEQIREGIKGLRLEHAGRSLGRMTLSAGAALYPDHGRTLEHLFQAADAALYQAKRDGRDRVVVADPMNLVVGPSMAPERERQH